MNNVNHTARSHQMSNFLKKTPLNLKQKILKCKNHQIFGIFDLKMSTLIIKIVHFLSIS